MPLTVVIVPDKFKGTLTAQAAAEAISRGWRKVRPHDRLELIPMSDGGDGFGEILGGLNGAKVRSTMTVDAAGRRRAAPWWWAASNKTAIVETAGVIGLALLPPGAFHPFQLDTFGLGRLLEVIAGYGAKRCLVGIGGSATNDGGFGMARALGWKFLDKESRQIQQWTELHRLSSLCAPENPKLFRETVVATDVKNRLLGMRGATRVYGPQKGLRPGDFALAERCLRRLAAVVKETLGKDFARLPGAGAAGGLGFALNAFLGASCEPGFDLFLRHSKLQAHIKRADLVLTGEGAIDASTMMGKGVGQVARLCREIGVPCVALAGTAKIKEGKRRLFTQIFAMTDLTSEGNAKMAAAVWLERMAGKAASNYGFDASFYRS